MTISSTGLSDDERKAACRGTLSSQWDGRDAFSVEEAGKILGLSRASAFAAASRGDIPTIRIGKRLIVPRRALEKLLGIDEDVPVIGQQALKVIEVPPAPPAQAPQRVELAIHVLPPDRRGRNRSRKLTPTQTAAAPPTQPAQDVSPFIASEQ